MTAVTLGVLGQLHILSPPQILSLHVVLTSERLWGGLGEVLWYTVGADCEQGV